MLFGLWHFVWDLSPFNPFGMLQYIALTFIFGLLFGYFYSKIRSLVPSILVHGLWNSFQSGMIMNNEVLDTLAQASLLSQVLVWFLPYAVAFSAVLLFTKYWVKEGSLVNFAKSILGSSGGPPPLALRRFPRL